MISFKSKCSVTTCYFNSFFNSFPNDHYCSTHIYCFNLAKNSYYLSSMHMGKIGTHFIGTCKSHFNWFCVPSELTVQLLLFFFNQCLLDTDNHLLNDNNPKCKSILLSGVNMPCLVSH